MPKIRIRASIGEAAIEDLNAFLEDLPFPDAEVIEAQTGVFYEGWLKNVDAGSATANRALAWLVLRQKDPGLKFSDIKVGIGSLKKAGYSNCPVCGQDKPVGVRPVKRPDGREDREVFCSTCRTVYDDDDGARGVPIAEGPTATAADSQTSETAESNTSSS